MSMNRYRLMAIDDEPKVLDAYVSLFQPSHQWSNLLARLAGEDSDESEEEDEFEFELECYPSGEEGVEALRYAMVEQAPFSIIFLDMRMPNGWSGLETARHIRNLDESVRIVLVSAYADHTVKEIRQEIGSRFVFHGKPWNDNELVQLTRQLASDWEYERELTEARHELLNATEIAVKANRAKDQFLASMSHELRTPLTAILGYGELLQETALEQEQRSLLKTMQVSGYSLLHLLNDILDLSKIAAGKFEIDQVEFDLDETLLEVTQIFSVQAENRGLQFEVQHAKEGAEHTNLLLGDGKRVGQILINLVSNAVKFTSKGCVRLLVHSHQKRLHFVVEDSGIGMAPAVVKRLFKPFEQADSSISGRFGGTGLGLHISQTLAQLMGGQITVESEQGTGSRFELTIPLLLGREKQEKEKLQQDEVDAKLLQGRVLVVEDTPELQMLVSRMIRSSGAEVDIADDGAQGVEQASAHSYDLILMDMQMPVMDGIEATRTLRDKGSATPIIALTANVMQHQREAFQEAGCSGFISKPVQKSTLLKVLQRYLKTAQDSHEASALEEEIIPLDDELQELLNQRVKEMSEELGEARKVNDLDRVKAVVHMIKGSIGSFGYLGISALAADIEEQLRQEDVTEYNRGLDLLNQRLLAILSE